VGRYHKTAEVVWCFWNSLVYARTETGARKQSEYFVSVMGHMTKTLIEKLHWNSAFKTEILAERCLVDEGGQTQFRISE